MSFKKLINNIAISDNLLISNFFLNKLNYGVNKHYYTCFKHRIERVKDCSSLELKNKFLLNIFFCDIVPLNFNFKERALVFIYLQSFLNCYKAWRQIKNLPSNGQRSWSNGWTPTRNNNILRNFKFKLAKRFLKNIPINDHSVAYLAELENFFWKTFWFNEWQTSRVIHSLFFLKQVKNLKVDLILLSKGLVGNFSKIGKNATQPKKHKKHGNATIGFDVGFTKIILDPLKNVSYSIKLLKTSKNKK